jgi:histidinol-phosphate aminotransferase
MIFNELLDSIKTYEPGKPIELVSREFGIEQKNIIKLASNENPYGFSKLVEETILESLKDINIYPDDSMYELKDAIANKFNLKSENIIIGAGSDQVIDFCIRSKCTQNSTILTSGITFAMYEIYAKNIGVNVIKTKEITHNLSQMLELYKTNKPNIIFLCTPNNPLGESLDSDDIYSFLKQIDNNTMVVIDGAYQEYAKYKDIKKSIDVKKIISEFENVIYIGTFSKAYGLGGMRCGYGISNNNNIKTLHKLRPPFNITSLSAKAALSALKDDEFIHKSIENNFKEMKIFENFAKNYDIVYIDSYTNFITLFFKENQSSSVVARELLKIGIIVRDLSSYGLNAIRVTIGTNEQNSIVIPCLEQLLKEL